MGSSGEGSERASRGIAGGSSLAFTLSSPVDPGIPDNYFDVDAK
jgi:hypothetical protein